MTERLAEITSTSVGHLQRRRLRIEGVVQGVGFRPHVHRLAAALGLTGFVENAGYGAMIEIQGSDGVLDEFLQRLQESSPPLARIDTIVQEELEPRGTQTFFIRASDAASPVTTILPPDIATCPDCLREINDPANRRYRYPFTNCTNCGPRYSIVERLPYDRPHTTMRAFDMCAACAAEYMNPDDRRFHAQPIACPDCGPHLRLVNSTGAVLATRNDALLAAAEAVRNGKIAALKGLGGYQLLVDARNAEAVTELRRRKQRPDKPLAVMFQDIAAAETHLDVSGLENELLTSKEAPIVLVRRLERSVGSGRIAYDIIAPRNPYIGAMLPYTPLHHLLMGDIDVPIVATSGNIADEPMITDDEEALELLSGVADVFLMHNRPIAAAVDDSVVRAVAGRPLMLRCARGYAPLAIACEGVPAPVVALGGHLKSTVAIAAGEQIVMSPFIGDLDSARARGAFERSLNHLTGLRDEPATRVACDCHPDYFTTRRAQRSGPEVFQVQHHLAHIAACLVDNGMDGPALGVVFDGTGYGDDGAVWGGEFFRVDGTSARRIAHLRPFRLPGGDAAIAEPRRAAAGILHEVFKDQLWEEAPVRVSDAFTAAERKLLTRMLSNNMNAPLTSSGGRLFDAVASLMGLVQHATYEGQAAMALEHAIGNDSTKPGYRFRSAIPGDAPEAPAILDWEPVIRAILVDVTNRQPIAHIAVAFHNALADAIVEMAAMAGERRVILTGGCFQNRYLTEVSIRRLRAAGFEPVWHRRLPPNDGSLAVGQAVCAARQLED